MREPLTLHPDRMTRLISRGTLAPPPLVEFRRNVHSQGGEDGILAAIFDSIGIRHQYAVEFGAWDGKHYSNCYNLVENHGWSGCFIEANETKFRELRKNYAPYAKAMLLNRFVSWEGVNALDRLLAEAQAPRDFDLLSIDIDGNDFWVWHALEGFRPRIVVIEFNPTCPNDVFFVQARSTDINQGCSLLALVALAEQKGYSLVTTTGWIAFFMADEVRRGSELPAAKFETFYSPIGDGRIWQGYDGTVVVAGMDRLLWSGVSLDQEDFQVLPRSLRAYSDRQVPRNER